MSAADDILFAPISVKQDIIIPGSWIAVINAIQSQPDWENATLAGGALRDLDQGRSIKDVDIFVPAASNTETRDKLIRALSDSRFQYAYVQEVPHNAHNTSQLGAVGISHFHFEQDGWKFEISQKTEVFDYQTLMDLFDIGLCMISLDRNNSVYRTSEYKQDVSNKTITLVRLTGGKEMIHAERIKVKYPSWTIIPM